MTSTSIKDLNKNSYDKFDNLIDHNGKLRGKTIYAIPVGEIDIVDKDGNKQIELINITFEAGEHIEEVRRGMNKWADANFTMLENDALWVHLGYYELMSDGMFRRMVATKGSMRE